MGFKKTSDTIAISFAADETAANEEDNEDPEPEPVQTEFDFGEYDIKHRKPN